MKKGAILALAAMLASSASHATESRAWALGQASLFIADSTDWKSLPQTPAGNSIVWEDVDSDDWMSASHDLLGGTLAIYNGRDSWDIFNVYANTGIDGPSTGGNPLGGWDGVYDITDVLFATNLSDSVRLGVGITWGSDGSTYSYEEPSAANNYYKTNYTRNVMGVSLGSDLKEVGPLKVLQLGLQYHMYNQTNQEDYYTTANTLNKVDYANSHIRVRVGGDTAGENGAFGRLELGLSMSNSSVKSSYQVALPADSEIENTASASMFNLGYAMGMSGEKGMILGGLNLVGGSEMYNRPNDNGPKYDTKDEYGYLDLVASAAAEASALSWLTIRGGVDAVIIGGSGYKYTEKDANNANNDYSDTYTYSDQSGANLNFGLTATVGNFKIDTYLENDIFENGPYFLSGESDDLFAAASVTYTIGE